MLISVSTHADDEKTLDAISKSCVSQRIADQSYAVPWSRHLLACLHKLTAAKVLVGARAVVWNPHFPEFSSPDPNDTIFGSVSDVRSTSCLVILDGIPPDRREALLKSLVGGPPEQTALAWILRLDSPSCASMSDRQLLCRLGARLVVQLPKHSLLLHSERWWANAEFDQREAKTGAQLWFLCRRAHSDLPAMALQGALGSWSTRREDFYFAGDQGTCLLRNYQVSQQDSIQLCWTGLVAATDGAGDMRHDAMGAGAVVGQGPEPILDLCTRVSGPISSTRAEAAALYLLLSRVDPGEDLLIFCDSLCLLQTLSRWGSVDFAPSREELENSDIIMDTLRTLKTRCGKTHFVKVKSHAGCMMNERADAAASRGMNAGAPDHLPAHWAGSFASLKLFVRPHLRTMPCYNSLPADATCTTSLVSAMVSCNEVAAFRLRGTVLASSLLQEPDSAGPIARAIQHCSETVVRCWMKVMCGIYPTGTYLHKIRKRPSNVCPYCSMAVPETLGHFAGVCPKFHDARTSAHNMCWERVSSFLAHRAPPIWQFQWNTPMKSSGLTLSKALIRVPAGSDRKVLTPSGSLTPDGIAVNKQSKKIAILEFSRTTSSLERARQRKESKYLPLRECLSTYTSQGWEFHVLPWIVDIRGLVDARGLAHACQVLDIPVSQRNAASECTAKASVEGFAFLHRVRNNPNENTSLAQSLLPYTAQRVNRGTKRRTENNAADTFERWKKMRIDPKGRRGAHIYQAHMSPHTHTSASRSPTQSS